MFAFLPAARTCKLWVDVLPGIWRAPVNDNRVMQYELAKTELDMSSHAMTMNVYKTQAGADPDPSSLRTVQPVSLACGNTVTMPFALPDGLLVGPVLPCAGEYVYHRKRKISWGTATATARVQLIVGGSAENPTVMLKETLDDGEADWHLLTRS
jgi:hypothetical protein